MTIEEQFRKVNTLQELNSLMRRLKSDGCSESEVNSVAMKRRKEILMASSSQPSKLNKVIPPVNNSSGVKYASFNVAPKHIGDNIIRVSSACVEI